MKHILESFFGTGDSEQPAFVFIHIFTSKQACSMQTVEPRPQKVPAPEYAWKFSKWTIDTFQNNLRKQSNWLIIETVTFNCLRMFLHITYIISIT